MLGAAGGEGGKSVKCAYERNEVPVPEPEYRVPVLWIRIRIVNLCHRRERKNIVNWRAWGGGGWGDGEGGFSAIVSSLPDFMA
jgi:hypothetical protein